MAADWRRWVLLHMTRALPCRSFEIKLVTQPRDGGHGRCIKVLSMHPDELVVEHAQIGRWSTEKADIR